VQPRGKEDNMNIEIIRVGDRIQFRSPTRDGARTVWRKVVALNPIRVRFQGWSEFQVHDDEIQMHHRKEETT
jgi:hypothetical protein